MLKLLYAKTHLCQKIISLRQNDCLPHFFIPTIFYANKFFTPKFCTHQHFFTPKVLYAKTQFLHFYLNDDLTRGYKWF